ncbi:pyrroloquinoline quinone-dependent dehydrogenase [Methylocella tundrae]|uniref:Pyrrolo-quinoline quinone n=1 Tax=Methylocella tundrae TaxID=227605 RepID=A0A4V6IMM7_METTU|nr:PQQ-binding-like beta-propeller repeat protein [Methylocella tundrae]WPP06152.1 PQQ-binding-like beta-propeller repeat protein [Methylocella tundrae]VFU08774.1 Pyrrolo-quinoline quinone [Methylocella tundrae]
MGLDVLRRLALASGTALAVLCGAALSSRAADSLTAGNANPNDWPEYHRTWNAWRYSPLEQVNTKNVQKLHVAWIHQPGDITSGLLSTPLVADGVFYYVAANDNVFALNGATGETIWHYQPKLAPVASQSFYASQIRNISMGHGFVYLGTLDGRVVAIDQKTGKEAWSTQLTDLKKCYGCLFSSTPVLAGDVLVGGTTGGDQPIAGQIFGVDALTGKLLWTLKTTKDDPKSWPGDTGAVGGSTAWNVGTYDPTSDTVFIGVGNAAPDFYWNDRHGDNLYAATMLALDPKTGNIKWHRQEVPGDHYDYDAVYEALVVDEGKRQLIVHLSKSGFVFVMDKADGKLANVWPLAQNYNWVKSIDPKTGELTGQVGDYPLGKETVVCPYLLGVRSWNPGAYNPKTKLWYTNAMEACETLIPAKQDVSKIGIAGLYLGVEKLEAVKPPDAPASARLDARDPITGKLKWSVPYSIPGLGGVLTTGGGLVFNGDPQGLVHAYDAENGKELWHFNVGSGVRAGIISYAVNGKQYIAVPAGWGSLAPGFMASAFPEVGKLQGGAAMVVFALD